MEISIGNRISFGEHTGIVTNIIDQNGEESETLNSDEIGAIVACCGHYYIVIQPTEDTTWQRQRVN